MENRLFELPPLDEEVMWERMNAISEKIAELVVERREIAIEVIDERAQE